MDRSGGGTTCIQPPGGRETQVWLRLLIADTWSVCSCKWTWSWRCWCGRLCSPSSARPLPTVDPLTHPAFCGHCCCTGGRSSPCNWVAAGLLLQTPLLQWRWDGLCWCWHSASCWPGQSRWRRGPTSRPFLWTWPSTCCVRSWRWPGLNSWLSRPTPTAAWWIRLESDRYLFLLGASASQILSRHLIPQCRGRRTDASKLTFLSKNLPCGSKKFSSSLFLFKNKSVGVTESSCCCVSCCRRVKMIVLVDLINHLCIFFTLSPACCFNITCQTCCRNNSEQEVWAQETVFRLTCKEGWTN